MQDVQDKMKRLEMKELGAARNGGWTLLTDREQAELLPKLDRLCHPPQDLWEARLPLPTANWVVCAPVPDPRTPKERALALDCRFVGDKDNVNISAQTVVVDVLTGKYRQFGLVLPNLAAAQGALPSHIGRHTIIVGHIVHDDFMQLQPGHDRVIDTQVLAKRAIENKYGAEYNARIWKRFKLQLLQHLLGRFAQLSPSGHDRIEDTPLRRTRIGLRIADTRVLAARREWDPPFPGEIENSDVQPGSFLIHEYWYYTFVSIWLA
ncbi:hypothetical protein BDW71DRAFT_208648 [Aspergillus fruticulosus]